MTATDMTEFGALRAHITGSVLEPESDGYDKARPGWNALIDRRPGAIARCADADDVCEALKFARKNDVVVTVRSGGHDYAGHSSCDGGLVIDLGAMNEVRVDAAAKRAYVQPGARWGAVDEKAQAHGLATTGGTVSTVGVAGYLLGGGTGHLARQCGLGLDNVLAAQVVTADGRVVRASDSENPELFWALRGGSGNFGIVTSFELRLHDIGPEVLAGQIIYPIEAAGEVLRVYRDVMQGAPDALQCYAFFLNLPPLDLFPEALHGTPVINLVVAYAGRDLDAGEEILKPLRSIAEPILDGVARQSYTALQQTFDAAMPKGYRWYSKAHYLDALSDDAIAALLDHTTALPGPFTVAYLEPMGGAIGRVAAEATAFSHRSAAYGLHIFPGWIDAAMDEEAKSWAHRFHDAMTPHATGGVYVNLLGPDAGEAGARAAYGANYARLAELKAFWDPDNVFCMNHNIKPGGLRYDDS